MSLLLANQPKKSLNEQCSISVDFIEIFLTRMIKFNYTNTSSICHLTEKPVELQTLISLSQCCSVGVKLTEPSDALAPTLSPVEFQHTSNMPPVPL